MQVRRRRFDWTETRERLEEIAVERELLLDDEGRSFVESNQEGEILCRFVPPLIQRIGEGVRDVEDYLERLEEEPGRILVVLLQAGASALGLYVDGELSRHKVFRRYVVRGKGRAQPTHLRTRGKSRYGSRLRLRNARRLLEETNERLREWHGELGSIDGVFYSCPVRLWSELFRARVTPPFDRDQVRVPLDLGVPSLAELRRAWRALSRGSIECFEADGTVSADPPVEA